MSLTIELLPDPAANDLRLTELVARRSSPIERLNILHGSGLQRLSTQRMLTEANGGGLAAIYGFTPVDLAGAAALLGSAPERVAWPPGADLATLRRMLASPDFERLDPSAPGVGLALLRTLTDLREAALAPTDLPKGDLRAAFVAWREVVATAADRTSRYEDAVSPATPDAAFRDALGGAPLIVSGIYDLTRIQRLLIGRLAAVVDVHMLLVAPGDDPASPPRRTLDALRREVGARVVQAVIPPAPLAPDRYFSVGDPTAEADEVARRILQLGREGVAFHRVAVLHQQGAPADDRICAALARADVPSWRIGGRQLANSPIGHATLTLLGLLLDPARVERAGLLDWLSHRALRADPLGITPSQGAWDRIAVEAGLTRGLFDMQSRLESWISSTRDEDAQRLAVIVDNLAERSRALEETDSWTDASDVLLGAVDEYIESDDDTADLRGAILEIIEQLAVSDALGATWSTADGLTAVNRAFGSRVVREPRRLIGGVNVGAATGPVRGIRYDAIFAPGVAERVFPAAGRQDPLLTDDERAAINACVPDALALQRDRSDSDRQAWNLMRRAAQNGFTASWSRRSSAVGGPARPSTFIIESASESVASSDEALSEQSLSESGRIERIASVGATESATEIDPGDATDLAGLSLSVLTAASVDTAQTLPGVWPESAAALHARQRRSDRTFTEFDGRLDAHALPDWRPLERSWSAAALETLVTCPYRFFLRYIIGAAADSGSDRPDRPRRDALGRLIRRILSTWVREYEHFRADRTWFEYANSPSYLNTVARRILDAVAESGVLGPPASQSAARNDIMRDLDRARRREAADARDGWRPLEVNATFEDAPIRVTGNRTLLLLGVVDRVDVHAGGRQRALSFYADQTMPDVRGFVNGSSFASIASLTALTQRGVPIREAEVEHRSVASRGAFQSQLLSGESLTTRGGAGAPSDGERLRKSLAVIADQLESASFIPHPGHPLRDRPNCRQCAFEPTCTPDLALRIEHKARQHPDAIKDLEVLRRQRV